MTSSASFEPRCAHFKTMLDTETTNRCPRRSAPGNRSRRSPFPRTGSRLFAVGGRLGHGERLSSSSSGVMSPSWPKRYV
jgi:hypothetical protein